MLEKEKGQEEISQKTTLEVWLVRVQQKITRYKVLFPNYII